MPKVKDYKSEYSAWVNMRHRCTNSGHKAYPKYGGRGIQICDSWLQSFDSFFEDMGPKLTSDLTLDRIDNNGDYSPENCRWATRSQQGLNRNHYSWGNDITINGLSKPLSKWSADTGLNYYTLLSRIKKGDIGIEIIRPILSKK